jgi:hypothetical protein
MNHWHDTMVDRPETDGAVYVAGWTISGVTVLAASSRSGFSGFNRHELVGAQGIEPWTSLG